MATKINDRQIKSLLRSRKVGRHAVGNGLYFRVSQEGTGFWVVRYSVHKKRREITIGSYPEMSLADANAETVLLKRNLKNNVDPLAERKRVEKNIFKTVDDLAEDWLKDCERRLKHPNIPRQVYRDYIAPTIGELDLEQVNPRDIRATFSEIARRGRKIRSNDTLMYCKQIFRHGIKLDLLTSNPAAAFTISDAGGVEKSRDRALSLEELGEVFSILREYPNQFARENYLAVALLVSLGVRKGELIAAEWSEFDMEQRLWHIPIEHSKTEVPITVPLSDAVMGWLKELQIRGYGSKYLFPKRRTSKRFGHMSPDTLNAAFQKLFREKKLTVDHFTVHDLRRTLRSLLSRAGVPGHVAERCLNHKLKGVEGIYDRYDYLDERREALEKVGMDIVPIINISL